MADALELTRRWLTECVLALELCPFAAPVLRDDSLHIALSRATDRDACRHDFLLELDRIQATTEAGISTTLLVFESALADFDDYLAVLEEAQDCLRALGLDETKVFLPSHVEKVLVPTRVKAVKHRIVDLSMGPNHTVCITEDGKLVRLSRDHCYAR